MKKETTPPTQEQLDQIREIMIQGHNFETACIASGFEFDGWVHLPEVKKMILQAEKQFEIMIVKKLWEEGGLKGAEKIMEIFGKFESKKTEGFK